MYWIKTRKGWKPLLPPMRPAPVDTDYIDWSARNGEWRKAKAIPKEPSVGYFINGGTPGKRPRQIWKAVLDAHRISERAT